MGLLSTAAKVAVASSIHGRIQRRQQQRWAVQDAAAAGVAVPPGGAPVAVAPVAAPPVAAAPVAPAPQPEVEDPMIGQLRQLAGLRDAGILTEEEFAAKKAKILGI